LIVIEKKMLRLIILFNKVIISIIFLQWKNKMNQHHHTNYQCFALHGKHQYDVINCCIRIIFIINISILIYYNTILYSKEIIVTNVTIFYCYYGCFLLSSLLLFYYTNNFLIRLRFTVYNFNVKSFPYIIIYSKCN